MTQTNAAGTVSGSGMVTVRRPPTVMRMTIQLSEKAESLQEALTLLKDRREAAILQLETLGAKKDTIKAKPATLSTGESPQQRQIERMLEMRRRQGRRIPKGIDTPEVVTVTCTMTAEWDIEATDHEKLLLFAKDIQDQVTQADLAGTKEEKPLSPEAAELAEEMEAMMSDYGEEQQQPGEPSFYYVARLSDEDRDDALAQAFQRAKTQADRLARAAGSQLGNLSTLNGMINQADSEMAGFYPSSSYSYQMRRMMAQIAGEMGGDADDTEALVPTPSLCPFHVMVNATFKLK